MIVKSKISAYVENSARETALDCIDELRWLCGALIDDEVLREQILIAATEQSGLHRSNACDRMITMWARRLVIKDCIAASKAIASTTPAVVESEASCKILKPDSDPYMQMPTEVLGLYLRGLRPLQRLVFVLRAIEGYTYLHIADLLGIDEAQCKAAHSVAAEEICGQLATEDQSPHVQAKPALAGHTGPHTDSNKECKENLCKTNSNSR